MPDPSSRKTIHCAVCGRSAQDDERRGDVCGARLPVQFVPDADGRQFTEAVERYRRGLPASIAPYLCGGILL